MFYAYKLGVKLNHLRKIRKENVTSPRMSFRHLALHMHILFAPSSCCYGLLLYDVQTELAHYSLVAVNVYNEQEVSLVTFLCLLCHAH